MGIFKLYKIFLILVSVFAVCGTIFLFNQHRTLINQNDQQEVLQQKSLQYRHKIEGFKFDKFDNGERTHSIKADKFTIEKKKLGFFRLGLINVATFKDALIDVYLKERSSGNDSDSIRKALPSLRDAFPSFSKKPVSSIVVENICLNLRDKRSLLTQLTSKSAIIRLNKHDILFEGNVRVASGDKILITEKLNFFPESFLMRARRHFILKTPYKKLEGHGVTVDFFLNVLKDEANGGPFDQTSSTL